MSQPSPEEKLSSILRAMNTPNRLRILASIGTGEACVCHLEALLDLRQAYISQQLMEMREAGLVDTRRDGRFIFYRLTQPDLLNRLIELSRLFNISTEEFEALFNAETLPQCDCPDCAGQLNPISIDEIKINQ